MSSARTSASREGGERQRGGSLLPLLAYIGVMLLLLLVFVVIGFVACSAPVPERVGFYP
jgi:hypothetical protein